jgi:hypothetical protein
MPFKPLFDMRATTIRKAFFLNAIVLAAVATISIELRRYLDRRKETRGLMEIQKFAVTMIGTFVIGVLIYVATRIIFGFGEGLIAQQPFVKKLL